MLSREHIGRRFPSLSVGVETGQLKLFCKAIGETNPIFTDPAAATAAGYRGLVAPPTFGLCLYSLSSPDPFEPFRALWGDITGMLHGGQSFDYFSQIIAGDVITLEPEITDIFVRKGGTLEFVIQTVTATNQLQELVSRQHMSSALRIG